MVVKFDILFEHDSGVYFAGQELKGKVVIHLNKPKKVRGLELRIKGFAAVKWSESGSDNNSTYYDGKEDYIKTTTHLVAASDSTVLDPGTHTFNFTCQLSPLCPSSFEGKYGHIRYTARVVLVRPWKFDQKYTKGFTVLALVDLNRIPTIRLPFHMNISRTFRCWPLSTGDLRVTLDMPQSGYVPGECLPLKLLIDNKSNVAVVSINTKLRMIIKFSSQHPSKKTNKDKISIAKLYGEGVRSKTKKEFNYRINIPATPPTSFDRCGIINIMYELNVEIALSGWNLKETLSAPVVIGTVPFSSSRQQQPTTSRAVEQRKMETYFGDERQPEPLKIVRSDETPQDDSQTPWGESPPPTYETAMHMMAGKINQEEQNDYGPLEFSPRYPVFNIPRNT
ncbi:arrestin domain-containing protein 17-like [Teleopsis dalmanni]|uniref:arrestin domain-containing protein 17-like n=1 Tax=Teleopsis dalmanni TaxID=139649 RepID=UPI0018CE5AF1|nr:arrestin domain-containing protein 17-like [Teleopsis dalmanni]